jgi:hypothetical protein
MASDLLKDIRVVRIFVSGRRWQISGFGGCLRQIRAKVLVAGELKIVGRSRAQSRRDWLASTDRYRRLAH